MWFGLDAGAERFDGVRWKLYTARDGIYGPPVRSLQATRDGSVYAGTESGLSLFRHGVWKRVFPIQEGHPWPVYNLTEAEDGSLWVATGWGALHLSAHDTTLYTTEDTAPAVRSIAPGLKLSIIPAPLRPWPVGTGIAVTVGRRHFDQGNVDWVVSGLAPGGPGEAGGILLGDHIVAVDGARIPGELDGPTGTNVSVSVLRGVQPDSIHVAISRREIPGGFRSGAVHHVLEDSGGRIWIGLLDGELLVSDPDAEGGWRLFTEADGLEAGYEPLIAETPDGTVWSVSHSTEHSINRFNGGRWSVEHIQPARKLPLHTSIVVLPDGTLWIAGVETHVRREGEWRWYSRREIPTSVHRTRTHLASDGALWIALEGREALRLDLSDKRWQTFRGLHFQAETLDGAQWFIAREQVAANSCEGVVRREPNGEWVRFTVDDGLMDQPSGVLVSRTGDVWVGGGQDSVTAVARFVPGGDDRSGKWSLQTYPKLSWNIRSNAFIEAQNGDLWFSSELRWRTEAGQEGGLMQIDPARFELGERIYHKPRDGFVAYGMAQTTDGTIWAGSFGLKSYDGQWKAAAGPKELMSYIQFVLGMPNSDLWVGTRAYGVFHRRDGIWRQHAAADGLLSNTVVSVLPVGDNDVWIATADGVHRFDGEAWKALGAPLNAFVGWQGSIRQSRDGAIWFQTRRDEIYESTRYMPDREAPETVILFSIEEVAQSGKTVVDWKGVDPWRNAAEADLQFAWRLDGGPWSGFSERTSKILLSLSSGRHTFEVKARDLDFNEDPTPARVDFSVVPPVWRQAWFISLMALLLVVIGVQTGRVVRRDRRLRESNRTLQAHSGDLEAANAALQRQTTDLEEANREVEEANRMKSQFLANMSHELRTPLNAILGFSQLMRRDPGLKPQQQENLEVIGRSGEHLLSLINDVLEMSKIEAGRASLNESAVDLPSMLTTLEEMFRLRAEDKGLVLDFVAQDGVPSYIRTDESKLRQILINLLNNAIKFTESGTVALRSCYRGQNQGGLLEFEVEDTGPGIPEEEMGGLFEAFVQTSSGLQVQEGTGLGLPISQEYAKLMGGEISVESEEGSGSLFRVQVHVELAEADDVKEAQPSRHVTGLVPGQPVYRILVVEDRWENRKLMVNILRPLGFSVREAENGIEAVRVWKEWQPHLVWMDIRMPEMDGYEATRRIKAGSGGQSTVVIALTASVFGEEREQVFASGCDGFIMKPFREPQLFEAMSEHLGVQFTYSEEAPAARNQAAAATRLEAEDLSILPAEWRSKLHQAASQADSEMVLELLRGLDADHTELAGALEDLGRNFRFDVIMELTRPGESG